jgi:hypothetical protein
VDKRTETLSARIPSDLLAQIQAIAMAHDTTVSDLTCQCLTELAAKERLRYEKLSAAFGIGQGLPGTQKA